MARDEEKTCSGDRRYHLLSQYYRNDFSREQRERRKHILIIETFRAIGVIYGKKTAGQK